MFITRSKKERLSLEKIPIKIKNKIRMNNVEVVKKRLIQRLGLNYITYERMRSIDKNWLEGYDQAKKDVVEIINQLQIYLPYLDDEKELP